MNKKILIFFAFVLFASIVSAQVTYCCEKTINNEPCVETENIGDCKLEENGITLGRSPAANCVQTGYCQRVTCVDLESGTCQTSYKSKCIAQGGDPNPELNEFLIDSCIPGCCAMKDTTGLVVNIAFVSHIRCKKLAKDWGADVSFDESIDSEDLCAASNTPDARGACVIEATTASPSSSEGFFEGLFGDSNEDIETFSITTACVMTTAKGCLDKRNSLGADYDVGFHIGYLCSAPELETDCAPSEKTICVEGRNEVFFVDTCGNICNVYDSLKLSGDNINYWTYIAGTNLVEVDCGEGKDSPTCGNCDYLDGSKCRKKSRGESVDYGEYICKDLDCKKIPSEIKADGEARNGETWCGGEGTSTITYKDDITFDVDIKGEDKPGSLHIKYECREGEVIPEVCSHLRDKVCAEGIKTTEKGTSSYASCIQNRWETCVFQGTEETCLNQENGICKWVQGVTLSVMKKDGEVLTTDGDGDKIYGACVPELAPAFEFWKEEDSICNALGTSVNIVKYHESWYRSRKEMEDEWERKREHCVENCYCVKDYKAGDARGEILSGKTFEDYLDNDDKAREDGVVPIPFGDFSDWKETSTVICTALGDCGRMKITTDNTGKITSLEDTSKGIKNFLGYPGQAIEWSKIITSVFVNKPDKEQEEITEAATEGTTYEEDYGDEVGENGDE